MKAYEPHGSGLVGKRNRQASHLSFHPFTAFFLSVLCLAGFVLILDFGMVSMMEALGLGILGILFLGTVYKLRFGLAWIASMDFIYYF